MKKLLPGILALLMSFGLAGCFANNSSSSDNTSTGSSVSTPDSSNGGSSNSSTAQTHEADLTQAKQAVLVPLASMASTSNKPYTVPNSFSFMGETAVYDISWTVTDAQGNAVTGVSIVEGEGDTDTVMISVSEDVAYVLTATLTCPDGCCSTTYTLNRTASAAPIPVAIKAAPVENTAYKLYVYQGATSEDCFLTGGMKNTYYFETTSDYEESIDLYVKNVTGGFNLYHVVNNENVYINIVKSGTHTNAKYQKISENATPTVWTWNTTWNTIATVLEGSTYYLGCDGTYNTVEPQYKTDSNYFMGYLCEMKDRSEVPVTTDAEKVATTITELKVDERFTLDKRITLPTQGSKYAEVSVTWAATGSAASLSANILDLTIPTEAATVTLTATIKCGTETDTKTFEIAVGPKSVEVANKTDATAILTAAKNLAKGEELPGEGYTLTGAITSIDTAWDSQYNNITVSIKVGEDTLKCYRLKSGDANAENLKVGDVITVVGKLMNYNGKVQFAQGCVVNAIEGGNQGGNQGGDQGGTQNPAPTSALQEGVAYTVSANNKNGPLYLKGTITSGRFDCSTNAADAVSVYVQNVDGGQLLYMLDGTNKVYFVFDDKAAGGSTTSDATAATVFEWNATLNTLVVAEDSNNRAFGAGATSDYESFSAYDAGQSGYNWGQFTAAN